MQRLLDAVLAIHEKDIIHRNITPHNIIFKKKNDLMSLKIINFESAIFVSKNPEEIETHCNLQLSGLDVGEFLKMRNILMNKVLVMFSF